MINYLAFAPEGVLCYPTRAIPMHAIGHDFKAHTPVWALPPELQHLSKWPDAMYPSSKPANVVYRLFPYCWNSLVRFDRLLDFYYVAFYRGFNEVQFFWMTASMTNYPDFLSWVNTANFIVFFSIFYRDDPYYGLIAPLEDDDVVGTDGHRDADVHGDILREGRQRGGGQAQDRVRRHGRRRGRRT